MITPNVWIEFDENQFEDADKPEYSPWYLVSYTSDRCLDDDRHMALAHYNRFMHQWEDDFEYVIDGVTHWRELPQPPEVQP